MFVEATADGKSKFSIANYVADLRRKGILSASNRTNPEKGVYESDTEEIFMDTENKIMAVKTPHSELLTSEKATSESLPCMKSVKSSVPSTTAIVSLDGKLSESPSRLLLFYMTALTNTGMQLSSNRVTLEKVGTLPVLLHTGKLEVDLNLGDSKFYTLYPLRTDGTRREGISLERKDGKVSIRLDTATLAHGPTFIFELEGK